jgi:hypothetical protein
MKSILNFLELIIVICLILLPVWLIYYGFTGEMNFIMRVVMVVTGLLLCRIVKPISILTGKDFKIF